MKNVFNTNKARTQENNNNNKKKLIIINKLSKDFRKTFAIGLESVNAAYFGALTNFVYF